LRRHVLLNVDVPRVDLSAFQRGAQSPYLGLERVATKVFEGVHLTCFVEFLGAGCIERACPTGGVTIALLDCSIAIHPLTGHVVVKFHRPGKVTAGK